MTKTITYRPGRFAELHHQYPQVWRCLNEPGIVTRMESLSRLGRPAVSALDIDAEPVWNVLKIARAQDEEDQVKQMVGHQIRQIMESIGYRKSRSKVIRTSWIFASGSVYRRPEWRRLYVHKDRDYRNSADSYCVSTKRLLSSLPEPPDNCARWAPYRRCATRSELNFVLKGNLADDFGRDWRELCNEVRESGYVILERE